MVLSSIAELNHLAPDAFAEALTPLFEAAAPLAEALYLERPFAAYSEVIDRAEAISASVSEVKQIEIVNAHPRIGAHPASISALSFKEQGYDRQSSDDDPTVLAMLAELNDKYEERFGFRFVVFVNKRPRSEILDVLRERMNNSRSEELVTALRDMFLIARDRLRSLSC